MSLTWRSIQKFEEFEPWEGRFTDGSVPAAPKAGAKRPATLDRGRDPEGGGGPMYDEAVLLSSRLPAMLVSRLHEMAQPVVLDAVEDFRREHAVHGAHLR